MRGERIKSDKNELIDKIVDDAPSNNKDLDNLG